MKKEIRVVPTFELLSEMEELQIMGGGDIVIHVHGVHGCNSPNTYCGQANCGCTIPVQPVHPIAPITPGPIVAPSPEPGTPIRPLP